MPQKRKSKTKKEMKKSINSLWTSLQTEKVKHAKASSLVGHMKSNMNDMNMVIRRLTRTINSLDKKLDIAYEREEHAAEVTADLIGRLK